MTQNVPGQTNGLMRQKNWRLLPWPLRGMAWVMILIQLVLPCMPQALANAQTSPVVLPEAKSQTPFAPSNPVIVVNREAPATVIQPVTPVFSANPTDAEITGAHIFSEPLVPTGITASSDNQDLAAALTEFLHRKDAEDFSVLTQFLENHPASPWRASLLTDLGVVWRHDGQFSKALSAWEEAWNLSKGQPDQKIKLIADRALAESLELNARLGRYDRLETIFAEIQGRTISGGVSEKIAGAREGLWLMKNKPENAFRCGPMALNQIRRFEHPEISTDQKIITSKSTLQGMSLSNVCSLANDLGMKYQMAKRQPGSEVILPAVIHWKVGHYAALLKEENGRYKVQDPTFGDEIWVTKSTLDLEASGYFLVPAGDLPAGWSLVNGEEGNTVWGKGNTGSSAPGGTGPGAAGAGGGGDPGPTPGAPPGPTPPNPPCPMAQYTMQAMLVSLHIWDTPVGYSPPRGLDLHFQLEYNQREAFQPSTFNYSSLGPKWTFNWLSYITDDPVHLGSPITGYMQGGGTESYSGFNTNTQSYALQPDSHVILQLTTSNSYTRLSANGYKQVYSWPDGSTVYPRNVFLTQVIDPVGNTLTFTYDSHNRIVAVTDAINQVTTVSYASTNVSSALYYQISKVTDPFGRFASFTYNPSNQLVKITDIIGISSQFTYGTNDQGTVDFINSMTTPYGTTTFSEGVLGRDRWLQATDPIGQTERMEYHDVVGPSSISDIQQAPPTTINSLDPAPLYGTARNSFFWDKKAMQLYAGDFSKAKLFHWLHSADINVCSPTEESTKSPLEGRIWFTYPGQGPYDTFQQGTNNAPATVARVLDDGTSQIYQYQYNSFGNTIQTVDPVGRTTTNIYAANLIDLLAVKQQVGASFQTISTFTYTTNHLPLTSIDAAGQTNFFAYNSRGQLTALTNALNQTVTMSYDTNGYLTNILGSLPGSTTSFTYDGYGRMRTVTDSKGYTITTSYDAADRPTNIFYPDGTYDQIVYNNLDAVLSRDRDGHWTSSVYDTLRHLTDVYDNLGRHTHFEHCTCGALESITDPMGNVTTFLRDLEKRVTAKIYPDGTQLGYVYETNTSRLKSMTDAKGQTTQYQYLIDDNLAKVTYTNVAVATPGVAYTYDTNFNRMLTMVDGIGTNIYSYYAVTNGQLGAGRLSSVDGPFANDTITYVYDALGRVTSRAINGMAQQVTYDALARITMVTNALGSFTNSYVGTTMQISTNFYPNGQKTVFSYLSTTNDERLQTIWNRNVTNGTLSKFDYAYDPEGQITNWTQQVDAASPTAFAYQYDAGKQLLSAVLNSTGAGATVLKQYAYGYDLAGNRTSEQIGAGTNGPVAISRSGYNNANQATNRVGGSGAMLFAGYLDKQGTVIVSTNAAVVNHATTNFYGYTSVTNGTNVIPVVATDYNNNSRTNKYQLVVTNNGVALTISYDLNGNETSVVSATATNSYQWDAANRLVSITGPTNQSLFAYDGLGRRVQIIEKTNGVAYATNKFVWDGQALAEQRDATGGTVVKRFFGQGEQISGTNYYFTRDHLGSVREMTDNTGTIQARYDYDPYGRRVKISGSLDADFGYTGDYYHAASGLWLTLYRAYSADLGRWLSRDPSGESSGLNLYAYCGNNPINQTDRLGLCPDDLSPFILATGWFPNLVNAIASILAAINIISSFKGVPAEDLLDQLDPTTQHQIDDQENRQNAPSREPAPTYRPPNAPRVSIPPETPPAIAGPGLAAELAGPVAEASGVTIAAGATAAAAVGGLIGYGASQLPVYGGGNVADFYGDVLYNVCPSCF